MKNAFLKPEIGENRRKERSYIALNPSLLEPVCILGTEKIYFIGITINVPCIDRFCNHITRRHYIH
jgi:hypothetical protein